MTGTRLVNKLARMMVCGMRGLHSSQFEWYRDNDFITASEVFLRRFFYYSDQANTSLLYRCWVKQVGLAQNSDPVHTQVEGWQMLSTSIEF